VSDLEPGTRTSQLAAGAPGATRTEPGATITTAPP
jgi:hypothetical protein